MNLFAWIRSFIMVWIFPVWTAILCLVILFCSVFFPNPEIGRSIAILFAKSTLGFFGIKIVEHQIENKPKVGCVFVFNHASFFDVFAVQSAIRGVLFGAKIELFKIPLLGRVMRVLGYLPIARGNLEKVLRVYERTEERIKNGAQIALAPEGTRSPDGVLLPFKSGPFLLAIKAKAPIAPLVVTGAQPILPKNSILPNTDTWTREVHIHYLPAVETKDLSIDDKDQLQTQVRESMLKVLTLNQSV